MKIVRFSQNGHAPRLGCFLGGDRVAGSDVLTDPAATGPDGRALRTTFRDWDESGLAG